MTPHSHYKPLSLLLFCLFLLNIQKTNSQTASQPQASAYTNQVILKWNEAFLEIDRYAAGYRPGPCPRVLGYLGLSAYESIVHGIPQNNSLRASFPDLQLPSPQVGSEYYYPASVNESYYYLMQRFFSYLATNNPTVYNKIAATYTTIKGSYATAAPPSVLSRSESYGSAVAAAVYAWESADTVGHNAQLSPQPAAYVPPVGVGLWQPTAPDYGRAAFPNWGNIRYFALPANERIAVPPAPYSEDSSSSIYKQAVEVYSVVKDIKDNVPEAQELRWVAQFWSDDLLNLTFSPPSRMLAITNQIIKKENLNLAKSAELYAKLGLALNDAGGSVWKSKYIYNIERPVSYIRRVLKNKYPDAEQWLSILDNPLTGAKGITPSFPSYPSGHSGFGGAGSKVLSSFFEYNNEYPGTYHFTDSCHVGRTEFNGAPRSFDCMKQLGEEDAYSRIPLGVHYEMDCTEGLRLGELAAQRVLELPWKKTVSVCDAVSVKSSGNTINISNLDGVIAIVQVSDSTGVKVYNQTVNTSITNIPNLRTGNYKVKVQLYKADHGWRFACERVFDIFVSGGATRLGSIGDQVYNDNNNNGKFDASDTPLANVKVTLSNPNHVILGTAVTNANGIYSFKNLASGRYTVIFPATVNTKPLSTSGTLSIILAEGQNLTTADAGYYSPSSSLNPCDSIVAISKGNNIKISSLNTGAAMIIVLNSSSIPVFAQFITATSVTTPFLSAGSYKVKVQLYDNYRSLHLLCEKVISITISSAPVNSENADALLTINAQAEFHRTHIGWVNNTGAKNDYFTVEKINKTTGLFETLEIVKSKSTDNTYQDYSAYDNEPTEGDNTYRVIANFIDGKAQVSDIKIVNFNGISDVPIFPNPADNSIQIDLKSYEGKQVAIQIFNTFGKLLSVYQVDKATSLPFQILTSDLATGSYFVRILPEGKREVTKQVTIAR